MSNATEPTAEDKLLARQAGGIAEIVFNNPAKHNAVSLDMWLRLKSLLAAFAADPGVRVLVVSGAGGKAFVSGADISKFESERATMEAVRAYNAISAEAYEALYAFPKPTIARIQGFCVGGGLNVAVCCDLRIAAVDARFAIPAARLGLGYGYAGVRRLTEVVSLPVALDLFYTARQIDAAEALRLGLVGRVVPVAALAATVDEITSQIVDNAPMTLATIKAVARELSKPSATRDLARLQQLVEDCYASDDYREGRQAFLEKRRPVFKGK